jgi:hypothetical protein
MGNEDGVPRSVRPSAPGAAQLENTWRANAQGQWLCVRERERVGRAV